jgi:hypothetical protein
LKASSSTRSCKSNKSTFCMASSNMSGGVYFLGMEGFF